MVGHQTHIKHGCEFSPDELMKKSAVRSGLEDVIRHASLSGSKILTDWHTQRNELGDLGSIRTGTGDCL